jgi:hypothetical protein
MTAIRLDWLADELRAEGLRVVEMGNWRNHVRSGDFTPVGVMVHHTASGQGSPTAGNVNLVVRGRGDIPGPLCNLLIARDGVVYVISGGRANDSGTGNSSVLNLTKRGLPPPGNARSTGDINGNQWYIDIEVDNNGVGEPYPMVQIDALLRAVARINVKMKWVQNTCIHHREWTSRKIDMSWYGDIRTLVGMHMARIIAGPQKPPVPPTIYGSRKFDMSEAATVAIRIPHIGYGLGEVWVDASKYLGRFASMVIACQVQGPYPTTDGWWMDTADVQLRAQIRSGGVHVTMSGCKAGDGVNAWVTFV